jgi:hypothetical protein
MAFAESPFAWIDPDWRSSGAFSRRADQLGHLPFFKAPGCRASYIRCAECQTGAWNATVRDEMQVRINSLGVHHWAKSGHQAVQAQGAPDSAWRETVDSSPGVGIIQVRSLTVPAAEPTNP